jgi:DNA polymerase I-like protein with 3'-5' exonuclease and polymerase domains/5'-3' exonuclease
MLEYRYAILDLRGTVLHSYFAGMTAEPLMGSIKEKVNTAEYGFQTWLNMYYDEVLRVVESPINIIAVLDAGNQYRKGLFPDYKKKRGEVEHDPVESEQKDRCMVLVKEFLVSQGVPLVKLPGQEADDVIAFLVENLKGEKVVYTKDNDIVALADRAHIMVSLIPTPSYLYKCQDKEKTIIDVPPSCITVFKSLVGDSSDGYGGVSKFGPKAWLSLVEDFGHDGMEQLTELVRKGDKRTLKAMAASTTNKAFQKAVEAYDEWQLMFKVAALTPSLCTGAKAKLDWYKRAPTLDRLEKVMHKAGCPDLIDRYKDDCYQAILVTKANLGEAFALITKETPNTPFVPWDYETWDTVKNPNFKAAANGRDYVSMLDSKIAGCSFAVGRNVNKVLYFSTGHKDTDNVDDSVVLDVIKHFEDEGVVMVAQNVAFEATITKVNFDHELAYWEDTKLYAHHIDENEEVGLKALSKRYLNYDQVSYKKTLELAGAADMSEISGEQVLSYGADDSLVTGHMYSFFQILTQLEGTTDFVQQYECPAVAPLVQAHIDGVVLNPEEMDKQRAADEITVTEKMALIRQLLHDNCSEPSYEGVEMLYKDQEAYVSYKEKIRLQEKAPDTSQSDLAAAIKAVCQDYKLKLKNNSFYRPLVEKRVYKEFIPTPVVISKVAGLLGLPAIEKATRTAVSDYVTDNMALSDDNQSTFLKLLVSAAHQMGKRVGDEYDKLVEFCNTILESDAKVVYEGTELNFGSPIQNQYLFYLLLGLPIRKRTKVQKDSLRDKGGFEGSPATDESAIEFALANDCAEHPWKADLLHALLEYKAAATRLSIYWTPYPLWLDENNVMHPGFSSCGTVTRRPTGTNPNLLQVSKGPVREVFVPRSPDNVIVSIDFSSEELRVLASVCLDPTFLSAYTGEEDKDLHSLTACGLFPMFMHKFAVETSQIVFEREGLVSYDWYVKARKEPTDLGHILDKVRGYAKTANFGVGYGAGPDTISTQLMIPLSEAELIVEAMNNTYPGINKWKEKLYEEARRTGYVATAWGSRRHIGTGMQVGSRREISRWERQASNFVIQATCADLLKVALVSMHNRGTLKKFGAYLIAPIYDELLFEVPKRNVYEFLLEASDDMEQNIPGLIVPMKADCSFGPSWGQQYEVGMRPSKEKVEEVLALM